jgi:hypothetical protein
MIGLDNASCLFLSAVFHKYAYVSSGRGWHGSGLKWLPCKCGRRPPDGEAVGQPQPRVAARSAPPTFWTGFRIRHLNCE